MSDARSASVVELFRLASIDHRERPAFIERGEEVSFARLWDRIARLSAGLSSIGFEPGDRAIVLVPMSVDLYVTLLAILKTGATAAFLDPWVGFRQLQRLARFSGAKAFIATSKAHLLRLTDSSLRAIPISVSPNRSLLARHSLPSLESHDPDERIHPSTEDDDALITFTTGSSGTPKGARRTHGILTAQHKALAAEFPAQSGDVDLCTFPVFALNNLALGVPTIIPPVDLRRIADANPFAVAEAMRRHQATTAAASPPLFDRLAELPRESIPSLRRILTGGAPVSDDQLRRWTTAFPEAEIEVVYGSTEAEPVAHIEAHERLALPPSEGYVAGRLAKSVRAEVVRIDKGVLDGSTPEAWSALLAPRGENGELIVHGDHVCIDYDRNPDAVRQNKIFAPDGKVWHRMGDSGRFDDAGLFHLVGRVHSTIVRDGTMLHAQVIERIARGDDRDVRRVAAVGLPDPARGEKVVIVIEGKSDAAAVRARLHAGGIDADEVIVTRTPLPVDPRHNSKIDYGRLREMIEEGKIR